MISKSWFCGLLTAAVLVCGCGEEIKKAKVERNMVKLETSMGNAVFGKVIEGMDVVDAIASVVTTTRMNKKGIDMGDVPVEPVVIKSARIVSE